MNNDKREIDADAEARLDALVDRFKRDDPDDVVDWPDSPTDRRFWDVNYDWAKALAELETKANKKKSD